MNDEASMVWYHGIPLLGQWARKAPRKQLSPPPVQTDQGPIYQTLPSADTTWFVESVADTFALLGTVTALALWFFECLLLEDCCGATDQSNHEHAIKMMKMQGGVFGSVGDSKALLAALG